MSEINEVRKSEEQINSGSSDCSDSFESNVNGITIQIRGKFKSGKSTVAQVIAEHLQNLGLNVDLRDYDHPDGLDEIPARLNGFRKSQKLIVIDPMIDLHESRSYGDLSRV